MTKETFIEEVKVYLKMTDKEALEAWNMEKERPFFIGDISILSLMKIDKDGNPVERRQLDEEDLSFNLASVCKEKNKTI